MRKYIPCLLLLLLLVGACKPKSESVKLLRFEQFLFAEKGDSPHGTAADFASPLINYYPDDPEFMMMVNDFVHDPVVQSIYRTTDSLYHDLGWLNEELGCALHRAYNLCPGMPHCQRVFTMVTADYNDYDRRVFTYDGSELCIALDIYALPEMERFQYFGLPNHVVRLCTREHLTADCMRRLAENLIAWPNHGETLLDFALAEGKTLYFIEQTMPHLADSIIMRYTGAQLQWMKANVGSVWAWIIENNLLYNKDVSDRRALLGDAPKTNAFGEGSAPRTAAYIGWQIVRQYMKKSGAGMAELFSETDSRRILNQSGWRP